MNKEKPLNLSNKMKRIYSIVILCLSLLPSLVYAGESRSWSFERGNLEIELSSFVETLPFSGYFPVEVRIENKTAKAKVLKLTTEANSSQSASWRNSRELKTTSSYDLRCGAGEVKSYSLLVPVSRAQGGRYSGSGNDKYNSRLSFNGYVGQDYVSKSFEVAALTLSDNMLFSEHVMFKGDDLFKTISSDFYDERAFKVQDFPSNLKALQGYGVIYFTAKDWRLLNKRQIETVHRWVRQGGILSIVGEKDLGASKDLIQEEFFSAENSKSPNYGVGEVYVLDRTKLRKRLEVLGTKPKSGRSSSSSSRAKSSTVLYARSDMPSVTNVLEEGLRSEKWKLRSKMGTKHFGITMLSLIVILFMIMVAPLNFFLFARQGQRHKLFVTTPIIAASASLLLVLFIIITEGFGGKGYQLVHQEIDQASKISYLRQEQFCRTGVLFDTSFDLDSDYELHQAAIEESRWARVISGGKGSNEKYKQSHQEGGEIKHTGNYFSSRSEHGHYIRGHKITHQKFMIEGKGDDLKVSSSFAHPIKVLYIRASGRDFYKAENLVSGVPVTAQKVKKSEYSKFVADNSYKFNKTMSAKLRSLSNRNQSFIAQTDTLPGVNSLKSIKWDCETVLTGTYTPNL